MKWHGLAGGSVDHALHAMLDAAGHACHGRFAAGDDGLNESAVSSGNAAGIDLAPCRTA